MCKMQKFSFDLWFVGTLGCIVESLAGVIELWSGDVAERICFYF
ncbi:hypothetical protein BMS3Abin17_00543 [archaeon BMS3Abin17]|nr:hypothetical protein BMS3Abin17_00543 [archaeon BMS3Abin17]